jgi:hypothetical protein
MNCWICGNVGDSGEHEIKASDLKLMFGKIDQNNPIVWYSQGEGLKRVKGIKSDILKFPDLICKRCNNQVSQPYDRAWEKLSTYLKKALEVESVSGSLNLKVVFPKDDISNLIKSIQLFFVKILGCLAIKGKIPIDLNSLSNSVLHGIAHDSVYLLVLKIDENTPSVGFSDVNTLELNGKTVMSCFFYMVGKISIGVVYDPLKKDKRLLRRCLHPKNHGYRLKYYMKHS